MTQVRNSMLWNGVGSVKGIYKTDTWPLDVSLDLGVSCHANKIVHLTQMCTIIHGGKDQVPPRPGQVPSH